MNVSARINSTEFDIVVPFLVKIVDEPEVRLCGNEFNNAIGYSSKMEKLLIEYMVLSRLGKNRRKTL